MPANKKSILLVCNLGPELWVRGGNIHLDFESIH